MMLEYIEREALRSRVKTHTNPYGKPGIEYASGLKVLTMIDQAPAADVAEVRHGKWDKTPIDKDIFQTIRCSECGKQALFAFNVNAFGDQELFRFPSEYCPSCGAKMDGKEQNR